MHYIAQKKVSKDGKYVVDYINTFLLSDNENTELLDVVKFLEIMESELENGSSFDTVYFEECKWYLTDLSDESYGFPKDEIKVMKLWLSKLDKMERLNITNTHKNRVIFNARRRRVLRLKFLPYFNYTKDMLNKI